MPPARLAVDIGGTFTDLALEHDGKRTTVKVLTTPAEPERGVMDGVRTVLATAGVAASAIAIIIHGTTLATNAIIERKGARTALLTTEGFRDVIGMGNTGKTLRSLDEEAVRALVPLLRREQVQSIAVGLLHAFVNPAHEQRVR